MKTNRAIFVTIYFRKEEEKEALKLSKSYERRGYSVEAGENNLHNEDNFIQLLSSSTKFQGDSK